MAAATPNHAPPRRRAAAVAMVVCSQQLVSAGAGSATDNQGQLLRLSYQLKDSLGRTAVDVSGMALQPMLTYPAGATLPPGLTARSVALPSCDATAVDPVSGIGECLVVVDAAYFPSAGSAVTVNVLVQLVKE